MSKEHTTVTGALNESELVYTKVEAVDGIVKSLQASFAAGRMRNIEYRKQQLRAFLRGLREERKALYDAVFFDLHKSNVETELFEVGAVEYDIGLFLDNLDKWARPESRKLGSLQPAFLLSKAQVRKEPLGTVLVIGAWNYPVRILLLPVVGALAAGNTVVVKPSELSPHTAVVVERVISRYMDPDVIRVVQGGATETSELLKNKFDHFFYTGGGAVGRLVAHAAAESLAGVTLELGGKSPVIVHADVEDLVPTATRIMWSNLDNSGQVCVSVDYLLVHRSIKDRLVPLLIDAAISMYGRTPKKTEEYCRIINTRHWRRIMAMLRASEGTQLRVTDEEPDENDRFIPPTIVDGVNFDDALMQDEIFGPILPIVTYDTLEEAIDLVNSRAQPLALYVFAKPSSADHIISHTRSGTAVINDTMLSMASHNTPFGGVGPSGVGNYTGEYSFDTFSHHRYVLDRPLWFPSPGVDTIRMPPYSGKENAWKLSLGSPLVYPKLWSLRDSILGKLFTLIPFWRILAIIPGFIIALLKVKPAIKPRKD
ncbi:hypothetical protein H4S08_002766 [Coemansia sp. RSA 1365]|nr:hypothetical protein H4S08_002766 [Coemansia sp. RSA 1365]